MEDYTTPPPPPADYAFTSPASVQPDKPRRTTFFWLALAACCMGALIMGSIGFGAGFFVSNELSSNEEVVRERQAAIDALDNQVDELEEERNDIEAEKKALQSTIESLEDHRRKLETRIDSLSQQIKVIEAFENAQFVVVGPQHAAGLQSTAEGFVMVAEAKAEDALLANSAAFHWRVPRVNHLPDLARLICMQADPGGVVPTGLNAQLKEIWGVHLFLPQELTGNSQLVSFRDFDARQTRVAYYLEHDDANLKLFTVEGGREQIDRKRVQPGSAAVGRPEHLLKSPKPVDFVDFCALKVAHELSQMSARQGESVSPKVAVRLMLDIPSKHWDNWTSEAGLSFGNLNIYASDVVGLVKGLSRRGRSTEAVDGIAMALEDQFCSQLVKLSVPVVEREELAAVLAEQPERFSKQGRGEESSETAIYSRLFCATHVLICELAEADNGRSCRIAVRLVDAATGSILWAENFVKEPAIDEIRSRFQLSSGELAVLQLNNETPQLMLLERRLSERGVYALRKPLSLRVGYKSRLDIDPSGTKVVKSVADVPETLLMPYLSSCTFRDTAPVAGLVTDTVADNAFVSLQGAKVIVDVGDRLPLFRISPYEQGEKVEAVDRLPLEALVTEVFDEGIKVSCAASGLKTVWSDYSVLEKGDIVFPHRQPDKATVTVNEFRVVPPPEKIRIRMGLSPFQYELLGKNTQDVSNALSSKLRGALIDAGINVTDDSDAVTHVIDGVVSPVTKYDFEVTVTTTNLESSEVVREEVFQVQRRYAVGD